ncbi:ATP binding [Trichomonas vaginalis G3]|nr:ATP binding [Trichomonas vaginalis G3]KAI5494753.1 ATP binding [Trichomonas vaginalis G3]
MTGVGIDLGTTFSSIAFFLENKNQPDVVVIDGQRSIPSVVGFVNGETIIGQLAKTHKAEYENQVIYDTKRALGKMYNDPVIQDDKKSWPFQISADENGYVQYDISDDGKTIHKTPESIAALLLKFLMGKLNMTQTQKVQHAVITVPTSFSRIQKEKIQIAAKAAGIQVVSFLPESSAAAIAYGLLNNTEQKLLIFDFGGGTLDVSVIEINKNNEVKELATAGDSHLGGRNIDNKLAEYIFGKLAESGKDYRNNKKVLSIVQDACERAKIALSNKGTIRADISFNFNQESYSYTITRKNFEKINDDIFDKILPPVEEALRKANLTKDQITDILAVGGSSHIPIVRETLSDFFDKDPLDSGIVTDEAIAIGAAIYCKTKLKEGDAPLDSDSEFLTKLSESSSDDENDLPPPRPAPNPVNTTPAFAKPPPARLGGQIALKVVNKVPHTIYTRDVDGYYDVIFKKGSDMPATKNLSYGMAFTDNGESFHVLEAVTIEIFEGNDDPKNPEYNLIKRYTFTLPKDVQGKQEATKETYNIDAAGNLSVNFKFQLSGKEYKGNVEKDALFHNDEQFRNMMHDVNRLMKQEKINL